MKLPIYHISLLYGFKNRGSEINLIDFIPKEIRDKTKEDLEIISHTNNTINIARYNTYFNPEYYEEAVQKNKQNEEPIINFTIENKNKMKTPMSPQNITKILNLYWSFHDYKKARKEFIRTILSFLKNTEKTKRKPYSFCLDPNESSIYAAVSFLNEDQLKEIENYLNSDKIVFLPPYNKSSLLRRLFIEYRNFKIFNLEYPSEVNIINNYKGEQFSVFEGFDEMSKYLY